MFFLAKLIKKSESQNNYLKTGVFQIVALIISEYRGQIDNRKSHTVTILY